MRYLLFILCFGIGCGDNDNKAFIERIYRLQAGINTNKYDLIPPSLIIAQAIYESSWGKSRFAIVGHNLFGEYCNTKKCPYMLPIGNRKIRIIVFSSDFDSLKYYIHNLNTSAHYSKLREIRNNLISSHKSLTGLKFADGLYEYSTNQNYVKNIKKIIIKYNLQKYDK